MSEAVQADILRLQRAFAGGHGEAFDSFTFRAFDLRVKEMERLRILVDDQDLSLADNREVARDDLATGAEDTVISGNVLDNDQVGDLARAVPLLQGPDAGALSLQADGCWQFDASTGFEDLAPGQSRLVAFRYAVTDADGDRAEATVTLTITGTNDAPVVTGDVAGAVGDLGAATATGRLTAQDVDAGDTVQFGGSAAGNYGDFSVDALVAWSFALNAASPATRALAAGQVATERFAVSATDGHGAVVEDGGAVATDGRRPGRGCCHPLGADGGGANGRRSADVSYQWHHRATERL